MRTRTQPQFIFLNFPFFGVHFTKSHVYLEQTFSIRKRFIKLLYKIFNYQPSVKLFPEFLKMPHSNFILSDLKVLSSDELINNFNLIADDFYTVSNTYKQNSYSNIVLKVH